MIKKGGMMMAQTNPRSRLAEIIRVFINYNVVPNFVQQNPEQVKAFEELGPTFIKIGQMLSVREDLLSSAFTQTFKHYKIVYLATHFQRSKDDRNRTFSFIIRYIR